MPHNFDKFEGEFKKQKRKMIINIIGLIVFCSIIFFGAVFLMAIDEGSIILVIITAIPVLVPVYILVKLIPQADKPVAYVPGKSCKGWRKTPEQMLKSYKIGIPVTIVVILLLTLITAGIRGIGTGIGACIGSVITLFYLMKRIKYHVPIDDATRFELETLGLISENDAVLSTYKDFSSWNDVKDGSKVLVLTQDNLVVLNFLGRENAQKFVLPLKKLERLSIASFNASGDAQKTGILLAMGLDNSPVLKLFLKGESCQDAPEVFISFFLKEVDSRLLKKPKPPFVSKRAADVKVRPDFRAIEIKDVDISGPEYAGSSRVIDL
jgi:uncharacterized membrane protein YkgB